MRDIVLCSCAGRSLAPPQANTGATVEALGTDQTINIAQLFQNRILLLFFPYSEGRAFYTSLLKYLTVYFAGYEPEIPACFALNGGN